MTVRAGAGGVMVDEGGKPAAAAEGRASPPAVLPERQPLKEWAPLHHLMLQVPAKYQNLLVTGELQLTCVSAVDEHILLGTNTGSVYWYDAVSCTMQRYRAEGQVNAVCRVSAVTSVDHLLAAGHRSGDISVFLVPRLARGDVPEYVRITERNIKKRLQFSVDAGHRAPVSALVWSLNAARLFSGDEAGLVAVTEIDYITETVACRLVLREPSAVVQLQYSRLTLLVATRCRSCLLTWPDTASTAEPRQVGTKPRKSPAELGACFVETEAGLAVLAARPSLKVVTADLQGQVSATISLKPTLATAGAVPLLFPVPAPPAESSPGPGRLLPLWPGAVALYDDRTLLVVDTTRWEIIWCCDQLPAVLDVAAAGDAIFVLCSARRLIRLSQTSDNHPAVCDNLRLANGDLSFDDVVQELKSAVPVNQVKTLLTSVHGQLGRSGLLDVISSRKEAVSSLTSRVSSLVAGRLGRPVSRAPAGPGPATGAALRAAKSSPDVRDAGGRTETSPAASPATSPDSTAAVSSGYSTAASLGSSSTAVSSSSTTTAASLGSSPATASPGYSTAASLGSSPTAVSSGSTAALVDEEPLARQVRTRRRPGRRRAARPGSADVRSLETVSLGGETAAASEGEARCRSRAEEGGASERTAGGAAAELVGPGIGPGSDRKLSVTGEGSVGTEERTVEGGGAGRDGGGGGERFKDPAAAAAAALPQGRLDFTQFYPREVRPCLQRTDSELEEERRDKERRLAALLGLEELSAPSLPTVAASSGSSPSPSPPAAGQAKHQQMSRSADVAGLSLGPSGGGCLGGENTWETAEQEPGPESQPEPAEPAPEPAPEREPEPEPEPEPSYHTLFPFNTKRTLPPPPPRPPSADSETGERRGHVIEVQYPDDPLPPSPDDLLPSPATLPTRTAPPVPAAPPAASPADLEVGTELTEGSDPAAASEASNWRPWQRHTAPSYVMTLSACARYAVMTDPDCGVYWAPAAAAVSPPAWERLDYSSCQVAVSWDGQRVWRLDQSGAAYSLADPEPGRPSGSHWVRAARDVLQLAADSAAVWYIKRGGKLFVQRDLSAHRCASPELAVDTPGPIIHVTARQGVVWAVTDKGNVLWRVGISRAQLAGFSWEPLVLGSLRARAAFLTAGELGWVVDDRSRLHVTSGVSASLPRGMDGVWRRVLAERSSGSSCGQQVAVMSPGAALRPSLAVEADVAWLTEPGVMNVMTCRHHIIAVRWEEFVPRGRQLEWVEVHADSLYQRRGQLWAVTGRGQLYGGHGHDGDLQAVPLPERGGAVACVSAAPGTLWLLTGAGAVYVREGMEQSAAGTDWVPLDLLQMDGCRLVHLSVGAQSVWACDASGRVLVRLGPTVARRSASGLQPAWVSIDQPPGVRFVLVFAGCRWADPTAAPRRPVAEDATQQLTTTPVCVGPADQPVWALDSAGVPWRRCGLQQQPVVGSHWQAAGGVTADRLAISPAAVWARARGSGLVHRWMESTGQWCRVPGSTRHVSVSVSGELWVVHRGALYTLHEQTLRPGRCVVPRVTDRTPAAPAATDDTEDQDWELVTC